jgi:hypothetical protein
MVYIFIISAAKVLFFFDLSKFFRQKVLKTTKNLSFEHKRAKKSAQNNKNPLV